MTTINDLPDLSEDLSKFPIANISGVERPQIEKLSNEEINTLCEKIANLFGIANETAMAGICELIRRGAANAGTPTTFTVDLTCPQEKIAISISKYHIILILDRLEKKPTIRQLAETLSLTIVKSGLANAKKNPGIDQSGDLARRINTKLLIQKEKPLTSEEKVGCASYAQRIPNLDELCGSERLTSLLATDLEERLNSKQAGKPKKERSDKGGNGKGFQPKNVTTAEKIAAEKTKKGGKK